jgi:60 kDa SS-A/Ro ribonucleoprotein
MVTLNKKRVGESHALPALAGGFGNVAAQQSNEMQLRRLVMSCILWEDNAYIDGESIANEIAKLVPKVNPITVAQIAIEARFQQKLRHVPLFICREMCKHETHRYLVESTLSQVIHRPDELTEFLAIYWKDNGKKTLAAPAKRGLSKAFQKFNEYQLAKYNRKNEIKLRDVLRLSHPKPLNEVQSGLWKRLLKDELKTPDTWEVSISAAKKEDRKSIWERLITENKLGASAFLKNMRNMTNDGVTPAVIRAGLASLKKDMLLPIDFLKAAKYAPDYTREIESAMLSDMAAWKKLSGKTVLVVDVSSSMGGRLSDKSDFTRMEVACAMTMLISEICDSISVYATAGCDLNRTHQTQKVTPHRGFALSNEILSMAQKLGGGGIFTKQCLDYIKTKEQEVPDRIIVFSDSQDCDLHTTKPEPFGKRNYIIDVATHTHGVNYKGVWTAEIAGWSEHFVNFVLTHECGNN